MCPSDDKTTANLDGENKQERASLLNLPTELRDLILEEVLPKAATTKELFPSFIICSETYDTARAPIAPPSPLQHTSVLHTNRQLHHESLDVLYGQSNVQVHVIIIDHQVGLQHRDVVQIHDKINAMDLWPYVRNLKLTVNLRRNDCSCCKLFNVKIRELAEALKGGKMLRRLHVRIDWNNFEGMPWEEFDEACEVLSQHFDMSGIPNPSSIQKELVVEIAGDMDVEEKMLAEERLKDRMMLVTD